MLWLKIAISVCNTTLYLQGSQHAPSLPTGKATNLITTTKAEQDRKSVFAVERILNTYLFNYIHT